jgi:hypothetical protein
MYLVVLIILTLCFTYYSEHNWSKGIQSQKVTNEQNMAAVLTKLKTESQSDKLINLFTSQNEYTESLESMILSMFSFMKTVLWILFIWLAFHLFSLKRNLKV